MHPTTSSVRGTQDRPGGRDASRDELRSRYSGQAGRTGCILRPPWGICDRLRMYPSTSSGCILRPLRGSATGSGCIHHGLRSGYLPSQARDRRGRRRSLWSRTPLRSPGGPGQAALPLVAHSAALPRRTRAGGTRYARGRAGRRGDGGDCDGIDGPAGIWSGRVTR